MRLTGDSPTPLNDLRVVEFSDRIAGAYCGKLLVDAGADVVKVKAAGGDPLRRFTVPVARRLGVPTHRCSAIAMPGSAA